MVTGSRNNRFVCGGFGVMAVAALAAWIFAPGAFARDCAYVPPMPILDCNGNGVSDDLDIAGSTSQDWNTNGIPDECDFQICDDVWDGFPKNDPPDPFQGNQWLGEIDYNGDGIYWDNPEQTAVIGLWGCNADPPDPFDYSVQVSVPATGDPEDGYVASEYFRTLDKELECYAAAYSLSFDPRIIGAYGDVEFNHKYDWQLFLYDGRVREVDAFTHPEDLEEGAVIQIDFASTESTLVVPSQQGKILVKNPVGTPTYLNTGVTLPFEFDPISFLTGTACLDLEVVLDNRDGSVKLYIGGELKVATTPLDPDARRLDYFHLQPVANSATTSGNITFRLDKFHYCLTGPALMDWEDCNGNCVDDFWDIDSSLVEDCNGNAVPDTCEQVWNCSCEGPTVPDACIPCNHDHQWDFDTEAPAFDLGNIDCQHGWELGPTTEDGAGQILASGPPFSGQPGFSGRALMLSPTLTATFPQPQGIRGPRTHDEQPDRPDVTGDAGLEYWEFDVVIDDVDDDGDVYLVVWDECTGTFLHDDNDGQPGCFTDNPPLCFLIEEGEGDINTYAYFNAGVRFRYIDRPPTIPDVQEVNILQNGAWTDNVNGNNAEWFTNSAKHMTIKIDNTAGLLTYWGDVHEPGLRQGVQIHLSAGAETANGPGDRQVLVLNTSNVATAYFDNFRYSADDDCDHDGDPDAIYLLPDGEYHEWYCEYGCCDTNDNNVLDWCEDCDNNCIIDSQDIANCDGSLWCSDCNNNQIPDKCDIDPEDWGLPLYNRTGCVPSGGCVPYGGWNYYSRKGGGSFDSNTNGIPDECETGLDCDSNGLLDVCDLDCLAEEERCDVPGCGQGHDCQPNGTLDACENDCNGNLIADSCDIASGTSGDCQPNGIPDECEEDCNGDGTADECEITADPNLDCDTNGILDVCEVLPDCNANGIMDACDITGGISQDCQPNGVPDECDIREGTSEDGNENGIPDECEQAAAGVIGSEPLDQGTLWRTEHNIIRLTFDGDITAPGAGELLIQQMLEGGGYGTDLSPNFSFTVEDEGAGPRVLRIWENTQCLTDRTWFAVHNTGGWSDAENFVLQYVVLMGDVDDDCFVKNADASAVYPEVSFLPVDDNNRYDVDGDGFVKNADASAIYPNVSFLPCPDKPGGH